MFFFTRTAGQADDRLRCRLS